MRYWLGPWVWSAEGWQPPAGCLSCVDLRPLPAQAMAGGVPLGVGLFALNEAVDPGPAYVSFGIEPGLPLTVFQRLAWEQRVLGPGRTLAAADLRGALWESLTIQADPAGQQRPRPLVPNTRRRAWEVRVAGELWQARAFDPSAPEAPALQTLLHDTYRRLRDEALAGTRPADHHRKVLGGWVRKFALGYRWFQPPDVPDEPPLDPDTTIADTFNRADQSNLGTSSGGWSWAEVANAHDISGNQAVPGAANAASRADSDLSSDDHYARADASVSASRAGVAVRFSASAETHYLGNGRPNTTSTYRIEKNVAGTLTTLATANDAAFSSGLLRLEVDGSDLDLKVDGSSKVTVTDTAISGHTRCGLYSYGTGMDYDDFEAGDLAAFDPAHFAFPGQAVPNPAPVAVIAY